MLQVTPVCVLQVTPVCVLQVTPVCVLQVTHVCVLQVTHVCVLQVGRETQDQSVCRTSVLTCTCVCQIGYKVLKPYRMSSTHPNERNTRELQTKRIKPRPWSVWTSVY